jgi:hypothetical protein
MNPVKLKKSHIPWALEIIGRHPASANLEETEVTVAYYWVKSKIEIDPTANPSSSIYLAKFKDLPPPEFGEPETLADCCQAIRRVRGMRSLSSQEIMTLEGYGGLLCEIASGRVKMKKGENKGCFAVIAVIGLFLLSVLTILFSGHLVS